MPSVPIDNDSVNIPAINFTERGSAPATPASGHRQFYAYGTTMYMKDSNGAVWRYSADPMTTQDDLVIGSSEGHPGRMAKGNDGDILAVDPTTHHLIWLAPASLGLKGLNLAYNTYLPWLSASITLTISQFTSGVVRVRLAARSDNNSAEQYVHVRFNADTGANYALWGTLIQGDGTITNIAVDPDTSIFIARVPALTAPAGAFGYCEFTVPLFWANFCHKPLQASAGYISGTAASGRGHSVIDGIWRSLSRINTITLSLDAGNFAAGTQYQCIVEGQV